MAKINQEFSQRLVGLLDLSKMNQRTLAQQVGITETSAHKYCQKGGVPEWDILLRIAKIFDVSVDWLLTGKQPRAKSAQPPTLNIQTVPRFKRFAHEASLDQYIPIRVVADAVAAGAPSEVRDDEISGWALIYASREWMSGDLENYTCAHVRGESMAPILADGDLVAINHGMTDPLPLDGKMVAFRVDGGVTIKWLKFLPEKQTVVGVPENKDELDHVVTLKGEEINGGIVGKVAWWWSKR